MATIMKKTHNLFRMTVKSYLIESVIFYYWPKKDKKNICIFQYFLFVDKNFIK